MLWRYFSWANQTLAMIVLWTGAVFLHKFGYPPKACFIAALPATFMSAVSVTYFFQAPECLGLSTAIAYPVGIVAAALFLGIFIWRTLIVGKDDRGPAARGQELNFTRRTRDGSIRPASFLLRLCRAKKVLCA